MTSGTRAATASNRGAWAGRIMGGLAVLFMLFDSLIKVMKGPPRTSVLGAILLTGYLGGAVATHVRVGSPLLTHILFPTYVALLIWGALYLRDPELHRLIPVKA